MSFSISSNLPKGNDVVFITAYRKILLCAFGYIHPSNKIMIFNLKLKENYLKYSETHMLT